jgi:hypothetical protein
MLIGALAVGSPAAHADLIFNFLPGNTFSGTAPSGTLSADFSDVAQSSCTTANGGVTTTGGCVQLVITSNLGTNSGINENLDPGKALYLNIDPALSSELGSLTFDLTANTGFSQAASVGQGEDSFKADGTGGEFDILFTYTPSTKAFTNGESQTYDIFTSTGTIATANFDFLSTGGSPSWLAAIHVQNTGSNGQSSGWVGAPAPPIGYGLPGVLAVGGLLLGFKLWERGQKRRSLGTTIPHAAA